MNKALGSLTILFIGLVLLSFKSSEWSIEQLSSADTLRKAYSRPPHLWPKPNVDQSVKFTELGTLLKSPIDTSDAETKPIILLGKLLFFDPRLSASNKISCATCHAPNLFWADAKEVSLGHDDLPNVRNAPALENVWFYKSFFWDGRAKTLAQQAEGPMSAHNEMNQDLSKLASKISAINGYGEYFKSAFGTTQVTNERIFKSLATFQQTIVSELSAFDYFLNGDTLALTDQQLRGLHLFRTKARCMNCHYGPYFTDNEFHNLGLSEYGKANQDLGLYNVSKKMEDVGKFKTPGLRNVAQTGPWFHNGMVKTLDSLMLLYNMGMPDITPEGDQKADKLFPKNDKLLRGIMLSVGERKAIIAFLEALSSPIKIQAPQLLPK
ncbi:cytochrome-c peroxidase [Pedobacter sp.]